MDKKIKLEIKNRLTGNVIFEYEATNNTMRKTVEEAICRNADLCNADLRNANLRNADLRNADLCDANLRNANLCNADLCDADLCDADLRNANLRNADLRNADLRGCVIDYNDCFDGYGDIYTLKSRVEENSNLRLTELYENHDSFASRRGAFWRNLIIIREWEVVEKAKEVKTREITPELYQLIQAWLENSGYQDKRFFVTPYRGPFHYDYLRIVDTDIIMYVAGIPDGLKEDTLYRLEDGNKIVEA